MKNLRKKLLLAFIMPLLIFCVLEGVLALLGIGKDETRLEDPFVGFSSKIPLFVEKHEPGQPALMATAPAKLAFFNYQEFARSKEPNTYRIFCLGGSTTYGRPYFDLTSFSGWLREFLPALDPEKRWEVINAGGISYASYRVTLLMEELLRYKPDLFIVYTGHNEFLEKRTYRNLSRLSPSVLSLSYYLGRTRTFRLMRRTLRKSQITREKQAREKFQMTGEVEDLLEQSIGPTQYDRETFDRESVLKHYEFNLARMIELAHGAGAKIIFVRPVCNLKDSSPFKSEHRTGIREEELSNWKEHYQNGKRHMEAEKPGLAIQAFEEALRIDPEYSELHFLYGRALFAKRRYSEARKAFQKAVDEDICPLRSISRIGALCAGVADKGVPLIDYPRILEELCLKQYGHDVLGKEFLLDHVHPKIEGHRLLAMALLREMARLKIVKDGDRVGEETVGLVTDKIMSRVDHVVHANALHNLAKVLSWAGKKEEAVRLATTALETVPDHPENLLLVGSSLARKGQWKQALQKYTKALSLNPDQKEAHRFAGDALVQLGRTDEALRHYRAALETEPENPDIHHQLGCILLQQGKPGESIPHFQTALRLNPGKSDTHFNLGTAFEKLEKWQEAENQFRKMLPLTPADWEALLRLGNVESRQQKWPEAVGHYQETLRLRPFLKEAHAGLGRALFELKNFKESEGLWKAVLIIDPENQEAKEYLKKIGISSD